MERAKTLTHQCVLQDAYIAHKLQKVSKEMSCNLLSVYAAKWNISCYINCNKRKEIAKERKHKLMRNYNI